VLDPTECRRRFTRTLDITNYKILLKREASFQLSKATIPDQTSKVLEGLGGLLRRLQFPTSFTDIKDPRLKKAELVDKLVDGNSMIGQI
jgi:hypothetical protein